MDATVLLVMDVQRGVVERFATDPGYLQRLAGAIAAARAAAVPVVYVTVGFRPGHPEISTRNRTFSALAAAGGFVEGSPAAEIHPAVAPGAGDLVVTKRRPARGPRAAAMIQGSSGRWWPARGRPGRRRWPSRSAGCRGRCRRARPGRSS